jgi:hypothetical protein
MNDETKGQKLSKASVNAGKRLMMDAMEDNRTVTVCAECNRASCWQGEFMCDKNKHADTTELTVGVLRKLGLESSHYWNVDDLGNLKKVNMSVNPLPGPGPEYSEEPIEQPEPPELRDEMLEIVKGRVFEKHLRDMIAEIVRKQIGRYDWPPTPIDVSHGMRDAIRVIVEAQLDKRMKPGRFDWDSVEEALRIMNDAGWTFKIGSDTEEYVLEGNVNKVIHLVLVPDEIREWASAATYLADFLETRSK